MTEKNASQEEQARIKNVLRLFHYGLYVAASNGPDGVRAATLSWVTQVSFEPRLLAIAVRKGTGIHEAIAASRRFALHVVGAEQADFAKAFFRSGPAPAESQAVAGYSFTMSEREVPVFDTAPAWLECELLEDACPAGVADHALLTARVIGSGYRTPIASALALCDTPWHYGG